MLTDVATALLAAPRVTRAQVATVSTDQGVYILWFEGPPPVCLKVGIAGPRRGGGIRERLVLHYSSNPAASVLAKHLAADDRSAWATGKGLHDRATRQAFLANECYFQVKPATGLTRRELLNLEAQLIEVFKPCYAGRVTRTRAG
jgi:hypothetical protein